MMANFEEWIKMATDNKINSRNSWNFALIDYFHDLNVLKDEEDNINFQKASATLDGCVKIYSHRVDSVATETGKLLSGLAERKGRQIRSNTNGENDDGDEEDDDSLEVDPLTGLPIARDDPETLAKKKRTYNRVLETTLVDFESIRLKDLAQNLSIDPLFKKALADFDEGGAKSLLINTLHVDEKLRVVFDATTTEPEQEQPQPLASTESQVQEENNEVSESAKETSEVFGLDSEKGSANEENVESTPDTSVTLLEDDILDLGVKFLDFNTIETSILCPSMDQLQSAVADIGKAKSFVEGVNGQSDKFLTEKDLETLPELDAEAEFNYEMPPEDGEDVAVDAGSMDYVEPADNIHEPEEQLALSNQQNMSQIDDKSYGDASVLDQELLSYFDAAIGQNWRGREHWKVRNIKDKLSKESVACLLYTSRCV